MAKHRKYALAIMVVMLLAVVSAQATSHVRIVRLSYEDGQVQMDRTAGQGVERAILNSPIVEGSRVVTGTDGLAEVEFENNSTVRLGEVTEVKFRELLINDAGDKVNEVELVRGTMYFDTRSGKNDIYRVIAANRTFVLRHDSQMRFTMSGDQVQAAVLKGEAQFDNSTQLVRIKKNDALTVDATNPAGFILAKGVVSVPLDRWNNERAAYQTVYAYNNYDYGSKGLSAYGFQDLAYYGGFMTLPGYGMVWQPYGVSSWMGWDPYMSGAWAFTPGLGYAWASAYPWGWLPYHYGAWGYQYGIGWFWCPGNSFSGGGAVTNWQATAPVVKGPAGYTPPAPPIMSSSGPRPSLQVGQIGRMPAYIPGGPVPPNFRSVITDHSGITGTTASTTGVPGGRGSSAAALNFRAANLSGTNNPPANGNTFVTPKPGTSKAGVSQNSVGNGSTHASHVFAAPSSPRLGPGGASGYGSGAATRSSGGVGHATSMGGGGHSGSGVVHK